MTHTPDLTIAPVVQPDYYQKQERVGGPKLNSSVVFICS